MHTFCHHIPPKSLVPPPTCVDDLTGAGLAQLRGQFALWRWQVHDLVRKAVVDHYSFDAGNRPGKQGPWHNSGKFDKDKGAWFLQGRSPFDPFLQQIRHRSFQCFGPAADAWHTMHGVVRCSLTPLSGSRATQISGWLVTGSVLMSLCDVCIHFQSGLLRQSLDPGGQARRHCLHLLLLPPLSPTYGTSPLQNSHVHVPFVQSHDTESRASMAHWTPMAGPRSERVSFNLRAAPHPLETRVAWTPYLWRLSQTLRPW